MTLNTHSRQKHWLGRCHFQPFFREAPSVTTYASAITHPVIGGEEGNFLPDKLDFCLIISFLQDSAIAIRDNPLRKLEMSLLLCYIFLSPPKGKGALCAAIIGCGQTWFLHVNQKVSNNWINFSERGIQNGTSISKNLKLLYKIYA